MAATWVETPSPSQSRYARALPEAVLLVRPENHAERSPGREGEAPDYRQRLPRRDTCGAVVVCPLAHVPGIEMPSHDYDLFGFLTALDLGDEVEGLRVGNHSRFHR